MKPSRDVARLVEIMAALRAPGTGCPWDIEQDFASIAPYTIEEAHEVAEAIARNDMVDLREELGDLLLQVVYHARMAEEAGAFAFPDVVDAITTKMIRRHPHVFGDDEARAAGAAKGFWEKIKAEEKAERRAARAAAGLPPLDTTGVLGGIGRGLPPLQRALKLQEKASTVGFDWNDPRAVLAKLREEIDEIEVELDAGDAGRDHLAGEIGDLMFAVVNLARHTLARMRSRRSAGARTRSSSGGSRRSRRRWPPNGRTPADASLDEMEALWQAAKATAGPRHRSAPTAPVPAGKRRSRRPGGQGSRRDFGNAASGSARPFPLRHADECCDGGASSALSSRLEDLAQVRRA
jgi:ATP diphosphatase